MCTLSGGNKIMFSEGLRQDKSHEEEKQPTLFTGVMTYDRVVKLPSLGLES